jgi:hypothetical protein
VTSSALASVYYEIHILTDLFRTHQESSTTSAWLLRCALRTDDEISRIQLLFDTCNRQWKHWGPGPAIASKPPALLL